VVVALLAEAPGAGRVVRDHRPERVRPEHAAPLAVRDGRLHPGRHARQVHQLRRDLLHELHAAADRGEDLQQHGADLLRHPPLDDGLELGAHLRGVGNDVGGPEQRVRDRLELVAVPVGPHAAAVALETCRCTAGARTAGAWGPRSRSCRPSAAARGGWRPGGPRTGAWPRPARSRWPCRPPRRASTPPAWPPRASRPRRRP